MFRNLNAEQARKGMTNEEMADYLGITGRTYRRKKENGDFRFKEIKKLLDLFDASFDYLFETSEKT